MLPQKDNGGSLPQFCVVYRGEDMGALLTGRGTLIAFKQLRQGAKQ